MKVLTKEQLDDYQQNKACYEIFHTYHPINENEQLIYKKTNPSNVIKKAEQVTHPTVVKPLTTTKTNEQVSHSGSDVVATDRRPQNPQFRNRGHQTTSVLNELGPNITDNTYQNEEESIQNTTEPEISNTTNLATADVNASDDRHQGNHFEAQVTATPVKHEVTKFIPQTKTTEPQVKHDEVNNQSNLRHANQFMPSSESTTTVSAPKNSIPKQSSQTRNNMISKTVRNTNKIENEKDLNAELYEQIHNSATQLTWIQQVNSFELGYKKDLRDLPIPALRTFDLTDDEEMYLPLNEASTLHDINSFTITKDMCILLLFRNNAAIRLAPEEWFDNGKNRKLLIKNGFEYYYKTVDANLLTETLKKISSSSASTPDMTQFIIKHMPFTPVES